MKKYLAKRIAFSIFSLFVVVMTVMMLVYTMIERSVIFQQDDTWNKKSNNDREMYEYVQYQKYGYLTYVDYSSFLKEKYIAKYGDSYATQEDFLADMEVIQDAKAAKKNASVKEFMEKYSANGYEVRYMEPITYKRGGIKPGGKGYLLAIQEKNVLYRLGDYLSGFFKFETTNDVKDPELTERYIRVENKIRFIIFFCRGGACTVPTFFRTAPKKFFLDATFSTYNASIRKTDVIFL